MIISFIKPFGLYGIWSRDQPDLYLHTHPKMVTYLLNNFIFRKGKQTNLIRFILSPPPALTFDISRYLRYDYLEINEWWNKNSLLLDANSTLVSVHISICRSIFAKRNNFIKVRNVIRGPWATSLTLDNSLIQWTHGYHTVNKEKKKPIVYLITFEQTWIPFNQGCFAPNLVEIGTVVLKKILKFVNVFRLFRNYPRLERVGTFILTNLIPLHPRVHCAEFDWN